MRISVKTGRSFTDRGHGGESARSRRQRESARRIFAGEDRLANGHHVARREVRERDCVRRCRPRENEGAR